MFPCRLSRLAADKPTFLRRCILRHSPRHHLYLRIYCTLLSVLVAFSFLLACVLWDVLGRDTGNKVQSLALLIEKTLPAQASSASTQESLQALSQLTSHRVALYDPEGQLIAATHPAPTQYRAQTAHTGWQSRPLRDGRWLVFEGQLHIGAFHWLLGLLLLAAICAFPIARRLSHRIEALQEQADALGEGNLSARVAVKGCDEIGELAQSFNRAAERIEALVNSQRAMLAAASHELRSPLARIRMATSLLGDERPDLQQQIAQDIAELDALIGDLLLASRLSSDAPALNLSTVDLLGLAAEEAARVGATLEGDNTSLSADARLLRHLIRNLLENARRHAAGSAIKISVTKLNTEVLLRVCDQGPGVPECDREKIFEPFYRLPGSAENGEGVGYGLALVRRIARLHGGEARCLPLDGDGACFEVRLPLIS